MTNEKSFRMAERWRDDIQSKMSPDPNVPILLLANKVDLLKNRATDGVSKTVLDDFVSGSENFIGWYERVSLIFTL